MASFDFTVTRALAGTYSVTRHVEHVVLWIGLSNCPSSNLGVSSQLPRGDLSQASSARHNHEGKARMRHVAARKSCNHDR
jgi:hypothetical protein